MNEVVIRRGSTVHTVSKTIACKQAVYYRSAARELGRVGVGELTMMTEEFSFSLPLSEVNSFLPPLPQLVLYPLAVDQIERE